MSIGEGHIPYGPYERFVKRPLDLFLSFFALIILSPLMGIVALLVRVKLGSPVIFSQERPGKDGKIFKLFKFRTMTDERDGNGELLPDDKRLTPFGNALRRSSLDELPELINILKGDMAIVGPRPLLVRYLPRYNERQKHRHDVRPGLTGLAQVNGRNEISWAKKIENDVRYVEHITFWEDLKIVMKTVLVVFKHDGISIDCPEFTGTEADE
ncbi:MAG: sugar transferase [Clostridiales bacterium]|nr:sugar transferase [Clostridiales bacterium]